MSNISIFQKHLGQSLSQSQHNIATNIQDINHTISALQTLNLRLKKCQELLQKRQLDDFALFASSCIFLNQELFDKTIKISLFGEEKTLYIKNLYHLYQNLDPANLLDYMHNSQAQISSLLIWIADNLDLYSPAQQNHSSLQQDCKNPFIKA